MPLLNGVELRTCSWLVGGVNEVCFLVLSLSVRATINRVSDVTFGVMIGGDTVFAFFLTEDSPPVKTENIRWFFTDIDGTTDLTEVSNDHIMISEDRLNLTLVGITHSDEGQYTLEATNEAGTNSNFYLLSITGNNVHSIFVRALASAKIHRDILM